MKSKLFAIPGDTFPVMNVTLSLNNTTPSSSAAAGLGWTIGTLATSGFGVVSNVVLLLAAIQYRALRTTSSWPLIVHCIVLNLITTAVGTPLTAIPYVIKPDMFFPANYCMYQQVFVYGSYVVFNAAEGALALHLLAAALSPTAYRVLSTNWSLACLLVCPWMLSVALNIMLMTTKEAVREVKFGSCVLIKTGKQPVIATVFNAVAVYSLTTVTGTFYVIVIAATLLKMRKRRPSLFLKRRLGMAIGQFVSFLWHCFASFVVTLVLALDRDTYFNNVHYQFGFRWLYLSFGALNPVSCSGA